MRISHASLALAFCIAVGGSNLHAAEDSSTVTYPADDDSLNGDILKFKVNAKGFKPLGSDTEHCAPKGSVMVVTGEADDLLFVRFKKVPSGTANDEAPGLFRSGEQPSKAAIDACAPLVNDFTQYKIKQSELRKHAFRRSGIMFGALVVPFKFYLAGDNRIGASSTIAPFLGFRGPGPFGVTLTPIVSAGLGLVSVSDATTGTSETKPAWSTAVGLTLRSSKNQAFNAGVLIGKDFLSSADRARDRTATKLWLSIYLGVAL